MSATVSLESRGSFYKSHVEKCMKFCVTVLLVGGQNKIGGGCAEESRGGAMTIVFCKKFGKDL